MDYKNPQTPPPYYGQGPGMGYGVTVTNQVNAVMRKVYVRMFIGLLITAFCSLGVASSPSALYFFFGNRIVFWGMLIGMIAMAFIIPARAMRMKQGTLLLLFCLFSALMGCWMSAIFLTYKITAIVQTFFITAGTFGAMSVYGYFTKSDLSKIGSYLYMAIFGLIIASIVNIFLASPALYWIISFVGVAIFIGITAWDTQQVRRMAEANLEPGVADRLATIGAMNLYLDFINLFIYLLRIFGDRN